MLGKDAKSDADLSIMAIEVFMYGYWCRELIESRSEAH